MNMPKRITGHENHTWVECYQVVSFSDASKSYVVSKKRDETWGCSCPRWIYHHETECKHIKQVRYALSMQSYPNTPIIPNVRVEDLPEKVRKALSRFAFVEVS